MSCDISPVPRQFIESDLPFSFPPDHWVRAFDEHRFYKAISGQGLKAVDFAVLPPSGPLQLIEVKNYHPRLDAEGSPYPVTPPTADQLVHQLLDKYEDSQRIIRIVNSYYQRKWHYRTQLRLANYFPSPWSDTDLIFWTSAARRSQTDQPQAVLHLAVPDHLLDFRRSVTERLSKENPSWQFH
ncbi:MAG: hypothetical protein AAFY36_08005 [Bacteroidota bacterium]